MDKSEHIGYKLTCLSKMMHTAINQGRIAAGIDPIVVKQSWIIGYLVHNEDKIICQKDLETLFHMPKSSATDTVTALEKAGLVERVSIENDARRKRIILTEKGRQFSDDTEKSIDEVEAYVRKDVSDEDMQIFLRVLEQMKANTLEYQNKERKKED